MPAPFTVQITDDEIVDLRDRLERTRWPDAETVDDWSQGVPISYLRELCEYWCTSYDFGAAADRFNAVPQFRHTIDGLDVHFLHARSPRTDATPLIMTHGWPGSVVEFHRAIAALTDPEGHGGRPEEAFHVVCPSLPGYGWSSRPTTTGWNVERTADAWAVLMAELGYDSYVAQGGDWGALVTTAVGLRDRRHCSGIHLNLVIARPGPEDLEDLTESESAMLAEMKVFERHEAGYRKEQSTRPQTLGYGLADSPTGQCAWIVEKLRSWSDCEGDLDRVFARDQILDIVMSYWLTNTAASSARMYWESWNGMASDPVPIPTAVSVFPREVFRVSRRWARARFSDLRYFGEPSKGGHFAAFEQPELFVRELRAGFAALRG